MSTNRSHVSTTTATADLDDGSTTPAPRSPTKTHYQTVADEFMRSLDAVAALIPNREMAHSATKQFVRTHKNFPPQFLATAVAAVEQTPELASVNKLDVARSRDALQFIEAFRPALDKLSVVAESLQFTMDSRQASLTADALQIYAVAKALGRDPNSAVVAAAAEHMKRDMRRRGPSPAARALAKAKKEKELASQVA